MPIKLCSERYFFRNFRLGTPRLKSVPEDPSTSVGFEPANLKSRGEHVTPRPPRPTIARLTHCHIQFLKLVQDYRRPLDLLAKFLSTDQDVSISFSHSAMGFFLWWRIISRMYKLGVPVFNVVCTCSVLCRLRKRHLQYADHRSGEALYLCSCSYMWSKATYSTAG